MRLAIAAAALAAVPFAANASPIEVLGGPPPANAPEVRIEPAQFVAPEVKIKAGETVKWVNADGAAHNVHFRRGPAKGAPNAQGRALNEGEVYAVKFAEAGTYEYIDTFYSTMKGKVVVE